MPLRTDPIVLPDLAELDSSGPRLLPLDAIEEDPDQPRTEFDAAAMEELASTIRLRGVLQPVSVRPHPQDPGRWVLNFGSRRYRASRLAGRSVIPAFVDGSFDTYAQVIENEQREALQPMELALFVKKRMALGDTQTEIGRLLGKSQTYVSMAYALVDAPDWLMEQYRSRKCRGLNELYQLRRLYEEAPADVEAWCRERASVGRADLQRLGARLGSTRPEGASGERGDATRDERRVQTAAAESVEKPARLWPSARVLLGRHEGGIVEIVTDEAPAEAGRIFVMDRRARTRTSVIASALVLLGFETTSTK